MDEHSSISGLKEPLLPLEAHGMTRSTWHRRVPFLLRCSFALSAFVCALLAGQFVNEASRAAPRPSTLMKGDSEKVPVLWTGGQHLVVLDARNLRNFYDYIAEHDLVFVMFCVPWSAYCKNVAPKWSTFADAAHAVLPALSVAVVECGGPYSYPGKDEACNEQGVRAFPTFRWYQCGTLSKGEYQNDRTVGSFLDYAMQRMEDYATQQMEEALARPAIQLRFPGDTGSKITVLEAEKFSGYVSDHEFVIVYFVSDLRCLLKPNGVCFLCLSLPLFAGPLSLQHVPWASHCKTLYPTWIALAEAADAELPQLRVAAIDCDTEDEACRKEGIIGYPSFRVYRRGVRQGHEDLGSRDLHGLMQFAKRRMEGDKNVTLELGTAVTAIQDDSGFEDFLMDNEDVFVLFHAPWCKYSRMAYAEWAAFAAAAATELPSLRVASVDCSDDSTRTRQTCRDQSIDATPSFYLYRRGVMYNKHFQGQRTVPDFLEFAARLTAANEEGALKQAVVPLGADSFKAFVAEHESAMILFHEPWAMSCRTVYPVWESFASAAARALKLQDLGIGSVVCSAAAGNFNRELCRSQDVTALPSFGTYWRGEQLLKYTGDKTVAAFMEAARLLVGDDDARLSQPKA